MKSTFILSMVVLLIGACHPRKNPPDKLEIVENFINVLNSSSYEECKRYVAFPFELKEMDYSITYDEDGFKNLFQWDSIFNPKYTLSEISLNGDSVEAIVSKKCKRVLFLNEEPVVTKVIYTFENNRIKSQNIISYEVFNDQKWSDNRASLVSWVEQNHPEYNGFIHDQTKEGALNYVKVMKLYNEDKKMLSAQ